MKYQLAKHTQQDDNMAWVFHACVPKWRYGMQACVR